MRAFIAIQIPEKIKKAIVDQTVELRRAGERSVRWVAPENLHLTIRFLGEIAPAKIAELSRTLETVTSQHKPFNLSIGGLGAFPNARRPRVVWIGVSAPAGLNELAVHVGRAVDGLGFKPDDKPFSAHLTIGRVREGLASDQLSPLSDILAGAGPTRLGILPIETVNLYQSELRPQGPSYTCLFTAALGGTLAHEVNPESA